MEVGVLVMRARFEHDYVKARLREHRSRDTAARAGADHAGVTVQPRIAVQCERPDPPFFALQQTVTCRRLSVVGNQAPAPQPVEDASSYDESTVAPRAQDLLAALVRSPAEAAADVPHGEQREQSAAVGRRRQLEEDVGRSRLRGTLDERVTDRFERAALTARHRQRPTA